MWYSNININNIHLKKVRPGRKIKFYIDIGNTIYYDVKYYQVKITLVNCTYVQQKGLKILTAHIRDFGIVNNNVTQIIKF